MMLRCIISTVFLSAAAHAGGLADHGEDLVPRAKPEITLRACEDFPGVVGQLIRSVAKAARERAVGCRG